ncbi:MAG TPA: DUF1501 domain-containing protein [Micropepsaceae bacterium]|nr:DUF1501 domain-containing protein [Micropepsaceae bacterium]
MNRRELLLSSAAFASVVRAGRLYAAPVQQRLLIVFMRGAYDAANVVLPSGSDFYYRARPNIAVSRPGSGDNAALPLDEDWALHPALKDTILPLYSQKQVAFIPFAGTDDTSRSHFETQDSIELGQDLKSSRDFRSGFMSRLASVLQDNVTPISFTSQLPLVFRGPAVIPNMSLNTGGKPGIDSRQAALIASMYSATDLAPAVSEGFQVEDEVYKSIAVEMQQASRGATSAKGFELEARRIARLMREKYNLGFVDVGGWDTHVNQGGASGYLANRIAELGKGVAGFADEIGPEWKNTVVVAISEFGRTFRENGNRGTDHGHGSVYWVLGGNIRGGRLAGDQVRVAEETLFQNRDFPVLNEYRAVLGGVFAGLYGLDGDSLQKVFPGAKPKDIGII